MKTFTVYANDSKKIAHLVREADTLADSMAAIALDIDATEDPKHKIGWKYEIFYTCDLYDLVGNLIPDSLPTPIITIAIDWQSL